jgi:sulfite reductase (NADPH) hemoprotein beta-component
MYIYDKFDQTIVRERVAAFRDQVARRLSGELDEDHFRPLRLMNGLYLQLHAYMLRVAIPYGALSTAQLRRLAYVARKYDRGYGHFTTRTNIQFHWIKLEQAPDILSDLADVQMHSIQTSGNCVRNTTADQFAGVAGDEVDDPRVTSEIIRQWSTFHPEFSFLPRKFKIAVTAAAHDRAAVKFHDIGLQIVRGPNEEIGYRVWVGGGMGRTPVVAPLIRDFLPKPELLSYLEAILRVYNRYGRRDNLFKARIKILVRDIGAPEFARQVEEEWRLIRETGVNLPSSEEDRVRRYFAPPPYETISEPVTALTEAQKANPEFARWVSTNVHTHKMPGYAIVTITLKPPGGLPGDASAEQMEAIADLADRYSFAEVRVTHVQNLVLPNVKQADLFAIWQALGKIGFADANAGLIGDIIACPGLDYCALANARSLPISQDISKRFADPVRSAEIGPLQIKISGCINACGHHHAGHIGILGVDRAGEELYQLTLGGAADENAAVGDLIGPGLTHEDAVNAIERMVDTYIKLRQPGETFLQAYRRVGMAPFKEAAYARA